jgi:very-short-patch-repair endonuclease
VELDGYTYHRSRRDHQRDADRNADLELAGYRVVCLTWGDVTRHRDRTIERLRRLLASDT